MPDSKKDVEISKSLSYLLRHGAKNEGIELDEAGWANVAAVVGFGFFCFFFVFRAEQRDVCLDGPLKFSYLSCIVLVWTV